MAIVGAGVIVAVAMPFGSADHSQTDRSWQVPLGPGDSQMHPIPAAPAGTAAVTFVWNSSQATEVYWYAASPCFISPNITSLCIEGAPLANWTGNTSGHWTASGPPASGYCVLVNNVGKSAVTFFAEFIESYLDPDPRLPAVPLAWSVAGGVLLVGLGVTAAYLGVFLPSGVFQTPAPEDPSGEPIVTSEEGSAPPPGDRFRPPG
jgi:hypothetical protein